MVLFVYPGGIVLAVLKSIFHHVYCNIFKWNIKSTYESAKDIGGTRFMQFFVNMVRLGSASTPPQRNREESEVAWRLQYGRFKVHSSS